MAKQNIDDQVVLNQFPDAMVVFLNLDDRGLPIRDLSTGIVPDIDDIQSISLTMGTTGAIGQFSIRINNNASKYFISDNMEREIENLNAGQIVIELRSDTNGSKYNTLPASATWGDVSTFLNKRTWNRIKDAPPVIHLYYRDSTDLYDDRELQSIKTAPKILEELKKGAIKARIISQTALEEFAKGDNTSLTQKGSTTGSITDSSSVTTDKVSEVPTSRGIDSWGIIRPDASLAPLEIGTATIDLPGVDIVTPDISNRVEGSSETQTHSTTSILQGTQADASNVGTGQILFERLSIEKAKQMLETSKTQAAFFEEFGGQLEHGRCMFEPMQLCMVFISRRFRDEDTTADITLTFTGYVDAVSDGFDGTQHLLTITGSDVTKLMNVTQANINPVLWTQKLPDSGYKIWQSRFGGLEGWEIIKLLTVGGEFDQEGGDIARIHGVGAFEVDARVSTGAEDFTGIFDPHISRTVLFHGTNLTGEEAVGAEADRIERIFFTSKKVHIQTLPFDTSPVQDLQSYDVFKKIFGMSFGNWQNDYQSHLEIAIQVARLTNYEFYADGNGEIWYHQPRFHNYHILTQKNPEIYILRDEDIINCNLTESDAQVITSVYVIGAPNFYTGPKEPVKMVGFYEDPSLVLKYGRRMVSTSHPYIVSEGDINFFARSYLVRANAGRYVGTVTILGRPEIRVHMPVYIPFRNMVYYIEGIQHSFTMGEIFTTTLKLRYGRKPWEVLPEILDYNEIAGPNMSAQAGSRGVHKKTVEEKLQEKNSSVEHVSSTVRPTVSMYDPNFLDFFGKMSIPSDATSGTPNILPEEDE